MVSIKEIEDKIAWVRDNDGVAWVEMGTLPDGRKLCLVFGWEDGYEFGDCEYQKRDGDTVWTLCSKLAVNIDDLQCDYDFDWYMPSHTDGEIYDTDTSVGKPFDNLDYYKAEAKNMIEMFKKGELEV